MKLTVRESNRWCAVEYDEKPTPAKIRKQILQERNAACGFSVLTAPAPAHDDTVFKVCGNERNLLVGIALLDSVKHLSGRDSKPADDTVEIFFDPLNDRIGWFQFLFNPAVKPAAAAINPHRDPETEDTVQALSHLPYAEAHSSACFGIKLKKWQWKDEHLTPHMITGLRCRWIFAWFRTGEVFRRGPVCGFNVCRNRPCLAEFSAWNYLGGNGSQDATSFGRLYRSRSPVRVTDVRAELEGTRLNVRGRVAPKVRHLVLDLVDPVGNRTELPALLKGETWHVSAKVGGMRGRFRMYPRTDSRERQVGNEGRTTRHNVKATVKLQYFSIDIPSPARARTFCLSITYDPPMSIISNYYTPERLGRDMELWADLGVSRIHWIEYGDWPSFWRYGQREWHANYTRTTEHCGDLLTCAADAAHRHGLEFIGDLKTFDLGFNCFFTEKDRNSSVEDIEKRHVTVIPEIAAHQEWTMQWNPAWRREASFPITRLRLYSEAPMPPMRASDIRLLTSRDNARYHYHRGRLHFRQGTIRRPHLRWTPANYVEEPGFRRNWYVELSGLNLRACFKTSKGFGRKCRYVNVEA